MQERCRSEQGRSFTPGCLSLTYFNKSFEMYQFLMHYSNAAALQSLITRSLTLRSRLLNMCSYTRCTLSTSIDIFYKALEPVLMEKNKTGCAKPSLILINSLFVIIVISLCFSNLFLTHLLV